MGYFEKKEIKNDKGEVRGIEFTYVGELSPEVKVKLDKLMENKKIKCEKIAEDYRTGKLKFPGQDGPIV